MKCTNLLKFISFILFFWTPCNRALDPVGSPAVYERSCFCIKMNLHVTIRNQSQPLAPEPDRQYAREQLERDFPCSFSYQNSRCRRGQCQRVLHNCAQFCTLHLDRLFTECFFFISISSPLYTLEKTQRTYIADSMLESVLVTPDVAVHILT